MTCSEQGGLQAGQPKLGEAHVPYARGGEGTGSDQEDVSHRLLLEVGDESPVVGELDKSVIIDI